MTQKRVSIANSRVVGPASKQSSPRCTFNSSKKKRAKHPHTMEKVENKVINNRT